MCSPELTRGMCQVCTGTLLTENTYVDRYGNVWDVHKGVCAIEGGCFEEVPMYHRATHAWYMERINKASTSRVRQLIVRKFARWIRTIGVEDHSCKEGTES